MKDLFDYARLLQLAAERREDYISADPFPHIALDGLVNERILSEVVRLFPTPAQLHWYKYDNPLEKKLAFPHVDQLPDLVREVLVELNGPTFVRFLQELTGIVGLVPDPEYNGGGLHQIERGGKLDIHADYNYHRTTRLDRRLNAIIYLNQDWREEYGGHLELWDRGMTRAVQRFLPVFNRLVVFSTNDCSWHGHPTPLTCPEGRSRRSLALYYYSNGRPDHERSNAHSTVFKRRPQDPEDPALEQLRQQRAKGRIADLTT